MTQVVHIHATHCQTPNTGGIICKFLHKIAKGIIPHIQAGAVSHTGAKGIFCIDAGNDVPLFQQTASLYLIGHANMNLIFCCTGQRKISQRGRLIAHHIDRTVLDFIGNILKPSAPVATLSVFHKGSCSATNSALSALVT